MKKFFGYFLSTFFILFTAFGLLGLIISHDDASDIVIGCSWTILGVILLYFSLKLLKTPVHSKRGSDNSIRRNKSSSQAPVKEVERSRSKAEVASLHKDIHRSIMDSVQNSGQKEKFDIDIPKQKNNTPLAYQYNRQEILELNYDFAIECAQNNTRELSANIEGDNVVLYSDRKRIGILGGKRVEMLKDWIRNKDPYTIILEGIDPDSQKAIAYLAFYRDKRAKMSYREQTTVKLTNCRKEDQQMIISSLENGDELYLSEEYNDRTDSEYVSVEESCVEIGRLPQKACERYLDEGAAGCFFDHNDYDSEKDVYIPYVTIYW